MRFKGSPSYVSTDDLTLAVNAAITLQRPLLVKGEPGTGIRPGIIGEIGADWSWVSPARSRQSTLRAWLRSRRTCSVFAARFVKAATAARISIQSGSRRSGR